MRYSGRNNFVNSSCTSENAFLALLRCPSASELQLCIHTCTSKDPQILVLEFRYTGSLMYACVYNISECIILHKDILFSRMILHVEMICREVDVVMSIELGPVCVGKTLRCEV